MVWFVCGDIFQYHRSFLCASGALCILLNGSKIPKDYCLCFPFVI